MHRPTTVTVRDMLLTVLPGTRLISWTIGMSVIINAPAVHDELRVVLLKSKGHGNETSIISPMIIVSRNDNAGVANTEFRPGCSSLGVDAEETTAVVCLEDFEKVFRKGRREDGGIDARALVRTAVLTIRRRRQDEHTQLRRRRIPLVPWRRLQSSTLKGRLCCHRPRRSLQLPCS